ncbi:hypothetical protein HA402_009895 [Bradysia odoriphaga]|nr:hypothetical protein HA402_009895 [Bradysia odoriphaga]
MFIFIVILIVLCLYLSYIVFDGFQKLQQLKIPNHRFTNYPLCIDMIYTLIKLGISTPEERFTIMADICYQHPDLTKLWLGPKLVVFANHPQRIQKILLSQKCADKWEMFYSFMDRESGLISARTNLKWKEHRKFFNFCFSLQSIESFVSSFARCGDDLCDTLEKEDECIEFDFLPLVKKLTFNMVCATALDMRAKEAFADSNFENIFDSFETTEKALNYKIEIPFMYPKTIYKLTKLRREEKKAQDVLDAFRHRIMNKRRSIMDAIESTNNNDDKGNRRVVLVDHIIRHENNFTSKEILDHVLTFIGGYETIANALAHNILLLAMHPKTQDKLFEAIQKSISSDDDANNSVIVNGIGFLECVLRESYRLLPAVPTILREVTDDFEIEPGLVIPKGVHLVINIYALHRQINIWGSDANEFKPERFAPEKAGDRHIFSFLPFSGGSRICIANKYSNIAIKMTIVKLLRKFHLKTTMKMEDIKLKSYISLKLCTEHSISLERRTP